MLLLQALPHTAPNSPLLDAGGGIGRVVVARLATLQGASGARRGLAHVAIGQTDLAGRALGASSGVADAALLGWIDAFAATKLVSCASVTRGGGDEGNVAAVRSSSTTTIPVPQCISSLPSRHEQELVELRQIWAGIVYVVLLAV